MDYTENIDVVKVIFYQESRAYSSHKFMLHEKIKNRESGIVLYGIVPPKKATGDEKVKEIAAQQIRRLSELNIDGLILYDIQDEETRTSEERPFPFIETLDSFLYSRDYLSGLALPRIIYRAVGKYSRTELSEFVEELSPKNELTVFVGASSKDQNVSISLREAYEAKRNVSNNVLLGGVTIPERHSSKGKEHTKIFNKISEGCSFFVSQGVYDVNASKNLLSDYYYYGQERGIPLVPIIFTLTPCGSPKTLQFMKWLGISIPAWLENELRHSPDILQESIDYCEQSWRELQSFAEEKGIPIGCNIESVAIRKVEVDASIELLRRLSKQ